MNRWIADVLDFLERVSVQSREARILLSRADAPRPAPEKVIPALELAKAQARRAEREEEEAKRRMHGAVFDWNREHASDAAAPFGRCDCGCGYAFRHHDEGECDHWKGRLGHGAHSRANGWRLRFSCHVAKTLNEPSAAVWNAKRAAYCVRADVPFVPRKELT